MFLASRRNFASLKVWSPPGCSASLKYYNLGGVSRAFFTLGRGTSDPCTTGWSPPAYSHKVLCWPASLSQRIGSLFCFLSTSPSSSSPTLCRPCFPTYFQNTTRRYSAKYMKCRRSSPMLRILTPFNGFYMSPPSLPSFTSFCFN